MRSGLSPSVDAMLGSAVLRMVPSSVCMKNAIATSQGSSRRVDGSSAIGRIPPRIPRVSGLEFRQSRPHSDSKGQPFSCPGKTRVEIFDYENVLLLPRKCRVESRSECDTSAELGGHSFKLPVVPANMKTVLDEPIAQWLAANGYF